jgi:hypothetical protein
MIWPFAMGERPPMNPHKPIEVYKDWQVDRLVESARVVSLRWWAFPATIAHTGRRVGEVLAWTGSGWMSTARCRTSTCRTRRTSVSSSCRSPRICATGSGA